VPQNDKLEDQGFEIAAFSVRFALSDDSASDDQETKDADFLTVKQVRERTISDELGSQDSRSTAAISS